MLATSCHPRPSSPFGDFPLLLTHIPCFSKSLSCWATVSLISMYSPFLLWRSQWYFLPSSPSQSSAVFLISAFDTWAPCLENLPAVVYSWGGGHTLTFLSHLPRNQEQRKIIGRFRQNLWVPISLCVSLSAHPLGWLVPKGHFSVIMHLFQMFFLLLRNWFKCFGSFLCMFACGQCAVISQLERVPGLVESGVIRVAGGEGPTRNCWVLRRAELGTHSCAHSPHPQKGLFPVTSQCLRALLKKWHCASWEL